VPRDYSPNRQAERYADSEQNWRWHDRSFLAVAFLANNRPAIRYFRCTVFLNPVTTLPVFPVAPGNGEPLRDLESSLFKDSGPAAALSRGESLLRIWTYQHPERHQGSNGNVLVIHQLFLGERQRFHKGSCLVLGLRVDQEDDAFAIAARIPLADFPLEVELHSGPDLCWHHGYDLLKGHALPGSLNDEYFGG
jgi:hypothetical protein